jgi:ERCC4-related helicase
MSDSHRRAEAGNHDPRAEGGSRVKPGDVVLVRGDRWRVLHVTAHDACAVVDLTGVGDANRGATGSFILPFEIAEPIAPPCSAPRRVRPVVFRAVARRVLSEAAPAWTSLRAAAAAGVTLLAYQLEPAIAMTRGLACRFLLADAVGLGKTIQAGLLVAELLARERDARVLIVTPAGLREQWREELGDRFGIDAEVLDAAALARATAMLPAGVNPWAVPRVILTSIDFVKRPDVIRPLEPIVWDLVAFDEAHSLSGRSDRAAAADLLARRGRRVVAITATPHSGDPRAYERLRGLGSLGPDDPILVFRRSRADAGLPSRRVARLLRVAPTGDERAVHRALDEYSRRVWREAPADAAAAARLAMMVLARRAASSAASLARSLERRLALLVAPESASALQLMLPLDDGTVRDDEEPDAELGARGLSDLASERRWLERIHALARAAVERESKIAALERILRRAGEPAIVFTEYRDTLEHLAKVLAPRNRTPHTAAGESPRDAEEFARLHGGMTAAEREYQARRFTHGDAPVLLATDAASEGLNLHRRCRLVINLEVPWTPLRLEQRIGRVDRLGQERRVHAIGLVGRGTAEEAVVTALSARAATAEREAPYGGANFRADAEGEAARLGRCRALQPRARITNGVNGPTTPDTQRIWVAGPPTTTSTQRRRGADTLRLCVSASPRLVGQLTRFIQTQRPTPKASAGSNLSRDCDRAVLCTFARHRSQLYAAIRLAFVDGSGFEVWNTVIGARCPAGTATFSKAMTSVIAETTSPITLRHDVMLRRLRDDVRAATGPLIAREEAMLQALHVRHGRLAAPLVQPGLFDRRALRDAEAQRRIATEAAATAAERLVALRRAMDPVTGGQHLVFVVEV